MGACLGPSRDADGAAFTQATGPAAQAYFHLESLPVSVSMTPSRQGKTLILNIVGLDCRDELPRLELAFLRRNLIVRQAKLISMSNNYVDQTFELILKSDESPITELVMSPVRVYSRISTSSNAPHNEVQLTLGRVRKDVVIKVAPQAEAVVTGVDEVLQLTVKCPCKVGVRVGIADAVRRTGYRTCCGLLQGTISGRLSDKLWLLPADGSSVSSYGASELEELKRNFAEAVNRSLQEGLGFDEKAARKEAELGDPSAHDFNTPPKVWSIKKTDELIGILSEADAAKNLLKLKKLPKVLHQALKKLEYSVNGPTDVGMQVPGFMKYTGLGLAERTATYTGGKGVADIADSGLSLVLELRTLFIKDEPSKVDVASRLRAMMSIEKSYAEFVSWLDVRTRTWTIFKVFLNEVLPSGHGYGQNAVAEHLLAPPELFFPTRTGKAGDIENEKDRSWMGSLMDSIPDLEMIRICDIVNWNTYMLVAIAASKTRTCAEVFGEHMEWVLKQELLASRMPKELLASGSMMDVVQHTCLGKLVLGALESLNKKRGVKLKMVSAEAVKSNGFEIINGETRSCLNLEIKLQRADVGQRQAHGHSRRLSAALRNLQELDTTGAGDAEKVVEGLQALSTPEALKDFTNLSLSPQGSSPSANPDLNQQASSMPPSDDASLAKLVGMLDREPTTGPKHKQGELQDGVAASGMQEDSPVSPFRQNSRFSQAASHTRSGSKTVPSLEVQPMTAVVGAMCTVLFQLQRERYLACLAIAEAAYPQDSDRPEHLPSGNLEKQHRITDHAFGMALRAMKLATKCKLRGLSGSMCRDGAELFQKVSVKAMLQRPIIEAACENPLETWMHRYLIACCGDTGYHTLITMLISWVLEVTKAIRTESKGTGSKTQRYQILVVLREHLGQHRALIAAKGSSRLEESKGTQCWDTINAGARRVQELLGSASSGHSDLQERLTALLEELAAMQEAVRREAREKAFSVPKKQILQLLDRLTLFIDEVGVLSSDELDDIVEASPSSYCFPARSYHSEEEEDWGVAVDQPLNCYSAEVLQLVEDLREGRFKRIVTLVGAGISVSANLPDFRSPGGLYDQMKQQGISAPESVFTAGFMTESPEIFYKIMKQLRTEDVEPTPTHCFLRMLQDKGLLVRCCTQNIDCLERKVGIKPENLVEAHGTLGIIRCSKCRKVHPKECLYEPKEKDGIPRCTVCKGQLRPNIVFFGEELNWNPHLVEADLSSADLVIIMGTSLQVNPFAGIINQVSQNCGILVVNRVMPRSLDSQRRRRAMTSKLLGKPPLRKEAFMQGNCDDSIHWLANELGWGDELEEIGQRSRSSATKEGGVREVRI